jgi:hypothetical protein
MSESRKRMHKHHVATRHNDISIFTLDETTTGTMAVVDLDGDGYVEIVSAGYTVGKVYVHTFAPE